MGGRGAASVMVAEGPAIRRGWPPEEPKELGSSHQRPLRATVQEAV